MRGRVPRRDLEGPGDDEVPVVREVGPEPRVVGRVVRREPPPRRVVHGVARARRVGRGLARRPPRRRGDVVEVRGDARARQHAPRDLADLRGIYIFNPTSMCAYANVSTQGFPPCFEILTRATNVSKNQPKRLRFDREV